MRVLKPVPVKKRQSKCHKYVGELVDAKTIIGTDQ